MMDMIQEQDISRLILVAEDDPKNMKLITDVLQLAGYRILKAFDGEEVITFLKSETPDIVIADICMANINGWELGFWLSENRKEKEIPIIFLSSLISEEGPLIPGKFGEYYMPKPFETKRLLEKIKGLL